MGSGGSRYDPRQEEDVIDSFEELFKAVSGEWYILLEMVRKIGENKALAKEIVVYLSNCPEIAKKVRIKHSFADNFDSGDPDPDPLPPPIVESGFELWPAPPAASGEPNKETPTPHFDCYVSQTGIPACDGHYSAVVGTTTESRVRGVRFVKELYPSLALMDKDEDSSKVSVPARSERGVGAQWGAPQDDRAELVAVEIATSVSNAPPCPVWNWVIRGLPSLNTIFFSNTASLDPPPCGTWSKWDGSSSAMVVFKDTRVANDKQTAAAGSDAGATSELSERCADNPVATTFSAQKLLLDGCHGDVALSVAMDRSHISTRQWATEYYQALQATDTVAMFSLISTLLDEFCTEVQVTAENIVEGQFKPDDEKYIQPLHGRRGTAQTFRKNGILYTLLQGTSREHGGDYDAEAKAAKQELLSCDFVLPQSRQQETKVTTPLVAVVDFLGFRVIAETQDFPLHGSGSGINPRPLFGTPDGGLSFATEEGNEDDGVGDEPLSLAMQAIAERAGLAPHIVGEVGPRLVHVPQDALVPVHDPKSQSTSNTAVAKPREPGGAVSAMWVLEKRRIRCLLAATVLGYKADSETVSGNSHHRGGGGRVARCLARLGRIFPPESPQPEVRTMFDGEQQSTAELASAYSVTVAGWTQEHINVHSRRLRPEWVHYHSRRTGVQLSSDAFSKFARVDEANCQEHNHVVHTATVELLTTQADIVLGKLLAGVNELQAIDHYAIDGGDRNDAPSTSQGADELRDKYPMPTLLDGSRVSQLLHNHGMNCRHLGLLATKLHLKHTTAQAAQRQERKRLKIQGADNVAGDPASERMSKALLRCMALRSLKRLLRTVQRDACRVMNSTRQNIVRKASAEFLNVVFVESEVSRHYWRTTVLPDILHVYGRGLPRELQVSESMAYRIHALHFRRVYLCDEFVVRTTYAIFASAWTPLRSPQSSRKDLVLVIPAKMAPSAMDSPRISQRLKNHNPRSNRLMRRQQVKQLLHSKSSSHRMTMMTRSHFRRHRQCICGQKPKKKRLAKRNS